VQVAQKFIPLFKTGKEMRALIGKLPDPLIEQNPGNPESLQC
jgi:hypothetical protein